MTIKKGIDMVKIWMEINAVCYTADQVLIQGSEDDLQRFFFYFYKSCNNF